MKLNKNDIKAFYAPLEKNAASLCAALNSGGFDASVEWIFDYEDGCPYPTVCAAGYGRLAVMPNGWCYRTLMPTDRALCCRFGDLACDYHLTVYGYDYPENVMCRDGDGANELHFVISDSHESFVNVELAADGVPDAVCFKKLLADIERSVVK